MADALPPRALRRIALSSLIVTTSMVACSGAKLENRPGIASAQAAHIDDDIEAALGRRDFARALLGAERLVEAEPRNAGHRTLLGRAYFANGRYASARTAFEDAMTLGAVDPRTIVSLSLVRTALGDAASARSLLSDYIGDLPAGDYGLAQAMAGDPQEGVRALLEAVRMADADARTRQNLAYAMALSGNWGQARLVAGQDMTGKALQDRMTRWAATANADAYAARVAALTGVMPRGDDSGQPARLALSVSDPAALAAAPRPATDIVASAIADLPAATPSSMADPRSAETDAPAGAAPMASAAPMPVPVPAPTPVAAASVDTAMAPAVIAFAPHADAPVIRASADPMREAVLRRLAQPSGTGLKASPRTRVARGLPHGGSDWVVQIGAYADARVANDGWTRAQGRGFEQRGYRKVMGTVTLKGKTFHRLAMSGFGNRAQAAAFCMGLHAQGRACFVRQDAGVANDIRMARAAAAGKARIASR